MLKNFSVDSKGTLQPGVSVRIVGTGICQIWAVGENGLVEILIRLLYLMSVEPLVVPALMLIRIVFGYFVSHFDLLAQIYTGRIGKCRENWLSPVIQTNWEARTVGWLEVERLLPSAIIGILWPHCGPPTWGIGQPRRSDSHEERRPRSTRHQQKPEFKSQPWT